MNLAHSLSLSDGYEAIAAVDLDSNELIDVNSAFANLLGYSRIELLCFPSEKIVPALALAELAQRMKLLAGRGAPLRTYLTAKDGRLIEVDLQIRTRIRKVGRRICTVKFQPTAKDSIESQLRKLTWASRAYSRAISWLSQHNDIETLAQEMCEAIVGDSYVLAWVGVAEDTPGKKVRLIAKAGEAVAYADTISLSWDERLPEGRGLTGIAVRTGQVQVMRDASADSRYALWRESARPFGIRSGVTVPFSAGQKIAGSFMIYSSEPDAFGPDEIELFENLGRQLGRAIEGIRHEEMLRNLEVENLKNLELLRDRESRLSAIIHGEPECVKLLAPDGTLLEINPAGLKIIEADNFAEVAGTVVYPLVVPEHREAFLELTERVCRGGQGTLQFEIIGLKGTRRWLETHATPFWDRTLNHIVLLAVTRDITEAKKAATRRAMLASIVEASRDTIGIASMEGRVIYLNRAAMNLVGLEAIPSDLTIYDFFPPADLQEFTDKTLSAILKDGWRKFASEFQHFRTHQKIPVEVDALVVKDDDGNPIALAAIIRDLTEKVEAEKYKAGLEMQLNQAQKMEALGRLTGGIAHDFNNSLAVVVGYADILKASQNLDAASLEAVEAIREAGARSIDLIRQLMGFSRQQMIQPRPVHLGRQVTSSRAIFARLVGEDVELRIVEDPQLWTVHLDPSQADQLLMNLLANARDAMHEGGTITIEISNAVIDASFARHNPKAHAGEYVLLCIRDTGEGMDADTAARIFEPFFTTKETGKGTGLGLATVYGIVRQNNGFIQVDSELGRGTTFKLYFPRLRGNAAEPTASDLRTPSKPVLLAGKSILLVEDDELVRDMTAELLRRLGHHVIAAKDAAEALAISWNASVVIDLVITDLVMPGMNGSEMKSRMMDIRPELKFLFVSGYTANVTVRQGMLNPDVHFLHKPFTAAALDAKIRDVLAPISAAAG